MTSLFAGQLVTREAAVYVPHPVQRWYRGDEDKAAENTTLVPTLSLLLLQQVASEFKADLFDQM